MLQFRALNRRVLARLEPPDFGDLDARVDRQVALLRAGRRQAAKRLLPRLLEGFDRALRTDAVERVDCADVSEERKLCIVGALDRLNRLLRSYERWLDALAPLIRRVNAVGRPARVLELACGYGEFTLICAELATKKGLRVVITGSDVVPAYLQHAENQAKVREAAAEFRLVNALDMTELADDSFDVAFIGQSLHHFTPGQIAVMVADCQRVCTTGFVAVDGRRSLLLLASAPLYGALRVRSLDFVHDALLSARKFYSEPELELIARMAAPDADVELRASHPGYSVLRVWY